MTNKRASSEFLCKCLTTLNWFGIPAIAMFALTGSCVALSRGVLVSSHTSTYLLIASLTAGLAGLFVSVSAELFGELDDHGQEDR